MADLIDIITQQLGGNALNVLSQQIGANANQTQDAVSAALPVLLGALAKNTSNSAGASSLASALDRDHDGSILDDVAGFLGNPQGGAAILGHVLGNNQQNVAAGVGKATGLNSNQSAQLLAALAPIVLGALGRQKQSQGLDASGLAKVLFNNQSTAQQNNPALQMLTSVLDKDGDGSIVDDLGGMLSGFLRR
ncbi:MAG: DUF937 domain-containing protein [Polyangiales bacterium]